MPEVASSLDDILSYDGDVSEDLVLNFTASVEEYGKVITQDLLPDGKNVVVTNDNRQEFVSLYLDWLLNK